MFKCPKCGETDLEISVGILLDGETGDYRVPEIENEADAGLMHHDRDVMCIDCLYEGKAQEFIAA